MLCLKLPMLIIKLRKINNKKTACIAVFFYNFDVFTNNKSEVNIMEFSNVYYEKDVLDYPLGKTLKNKYGHIPWIEIKSHNAIDEMRKKQNSEFINMKKNLIIGIRKTHNYKENKKISDFLVPYTSSGCSAMCLYCYLVCNYNKCSYLRLFVNREQMLDKLIKFSKRNDTPFIYEIGSNSDLILENKITGNLVWTIENFVREGVGRLTFPTKFDDVKSLLSIDHKRKIIFRMSVNPSEIIRKYEIGTSTLEKRINAVNLMCEAGYPTGILIAPVIFTSDWEKLYSELIDFLRDNLSKKAKKQLFIEIIFMTYSYVHRAINKEAFPTVSDLYDENLMVVRGRGKYAYSQIQRSIGEEFFRKEISEKLKDAKIIYFS